MEKPKVAIIMGSDSDFPIMEKCLKALKDFDVEYEAIVCSAHRTPVKAMQFAKDAKNKGFGVVIAAAGMAAHLPGVVAAYTTLPVIGVPIKSTNFDGLDALFSIVQMPPGVPVATVAVNGGLNSALLAVQILSVKYTDLAIKFKEYKENMKLKVEAKNKALQAKISEI